MRKNRDEPKQPPGRSDSPHRAAKGPDSERVPIIDYKNWEDSIAPIIGRGLAPGGQSI